MSEVFVRNATFADLDEIARVERETWPETMCAPREKFENRLRIFPEGFYVAIVDGKIVGVSTSKRFNYNPSSPPKTWDDASDEGWITKHDPKGDSLYVVSVGVAFKSSGHGIGTKLVEAQKSLVQRLGLRCLVLGARCPEFSKNEFVKIPAEKYIRLLRDDGLPVDREIRFYTRNGLRVQSAMPEYMGKGNDLESRDYGVIMVWTP